MRRVRGWLGPALLPCLAAAAQAQIGEVQLGVLGSYGTAGSYHAGGGLVVGVAAGRLTYLGLRWMATAGSTTTTGAPAVDVSNRVLTYAADLGVLIPFDDVEVIPSISIGQVHFEQTARQAIPGGGTSETAAHAVEFMASPGVAVEVQAGRFAFIPELQYSLSGHPDLPYPAAHRGLLATLRVVVTFEAARVRR